MSFKLLKNRAGDVINVYEFSFKGKLVSCLASIDDGKWEHVSVTCRYAGKTKTLIPSWEIMCEVKNLFWDMEDVVVQLHPKKSEYVNLHLDCLHLWRPVNGDRKIGMLLFS